MKNLINLYSKCFSLVKDRNYVIIKFIRKHEEHKFIIQESRRKHGAF